MKVSIVGSLRDREVACSASDRQGSNFKSCVWRTVSSQSSHHPQEVLLAQFNLYVHKGGLKPVSFHFIFFFNMTIEEQFIALLTSEETAIIYIGRFTFDSFKIKRSVTKNANNHPFFLLFNAFLIIYQIIT